MALFFDTYMANKISPRVLAQRRSQLRWRLAYMMVGLLAAWSAYWVATEQMLNADVQRGTALLDHYLTHYQQQLAAKLPQLRSGIQWLAGSVGLAMLLTIGQLYMVGGRPERKRSPAAGTRRRGGNQSRRAQ